MLDFNELLENFEYPDAKVIDYKGKDIFVKQYLPTQEKWQLIYICVSSLDLSNKSYNPLTAEILFDTEIVQKYSSINFEENTESYFKTFDILQLNGIIDLVIEAIPIDEYEEINRLYKETIESHIQYNSNIGNSIQSLFSNLPNINEEIEMIETEKVEKIIEMADKLTKGGHI